MLHDRHTQHLSSVKKDVLRRTETKHGERTKINRHCVWTRDIANSTTSQMMRSCVCTASAHCWSTAAAAGAATIWRHRSHYKSKSRTSLNPGMTRWHLIQQMNTRPVFNFHLVQRSLMELDEHALCITFWPSLTSQFFFFPKEGARKFLINLNVGDLERWKFQASGLAWLNTLIFST